MGPLENLSRKLVLEDKVYAIKTQSEKKEKEINEGENPDVKAYAIKNKSNVKTPKTSTMKNASENISRKPVLEDKAYAIKTQSEKKDKEINEGENPDVKAYAIKKKSNVKTPKKS